MEEVANHLKELTKQWNIANGNKYSNPKAKY